MPRHNVHDATLDDLMLIGSWLCAADREEMALTRDPDDYESLAFDAWDSPFRHVALDEARPVFAFGAKPFRSDTALVWGFKTEQGWDAARTVTKYINRTMIPELRAIGIRRATCFVHPANVRSQKWLAFLDFRPKATLRGFGPRKQDIILFQRDEPDASPDQ
jgi:hypothetical protein